MASHSIVPQNYAIHVVQKRISIDALIFQLYQTPSEYTTQHFKFVNSHLVDGYAKPGQLVMISPADTLECTEIEIEFQKYAREADKKLRELNELEREELAKRYDLLSNVAKYNGLALGTANNNWNAHVKQVEALLKELERTYVNSYNRTGGVANSQFYQRRRQILGRLDRALLRFGQPSFGGNVMPGNMRRNLGLSSKSIVHHWNRQGGIANNIPGFFDNYKTVANMSKNLKRVGYVGIALTGVEASANIARACLDGDEQACRKSKFVETGKAVGGIGGGIAGGYLGSYVTCNIVFGLPSSGTSAFWCAVVAGGVGGAAGGLVGSNAVGSLGESLHEVSK